MKVEPVAWQCDAGLGLQRFVTDSRYQKFAKSIQDFYRPYNAIPDGYALVPVEPTEAQWSGLARDIMFVLRQERPTPKKLFYHLTQLGHTLPNWLADETELRDPASDHVISKGTCCALIYKAMLTAAAKGE